jgi:bifunctional lysine-specific demethylase and histidyl-hydroxylase NO66
VTVPPLCRCVGVARPEFADRYWDREPLLSKGVGDFTDLLSLADVDELLSRRGLRTPFIRMATHGTLIPPARYTGAGGAGAEVADQALDERVAGLLAEGATLVLQGLHRLWPPLVDFAVALRRDLGTPVQVNAYLTPPGNRGFAAHYDTHAVFVLQVAGCKRWRVHPPVVEHPIESQPSGRRVEEVSAVASGEPVLDTVLAPGDTLYLPRGWLHTADAQQDISLHLTIGLRAPTRYTLVEALLRLAADEPSLRAGLPLGVDLADDAALGPVFADTIQALHTWLDRLPADEWARRLRGTAWSAIRPAPLAPVAQVAALNDLTLDRRITVRGGLPWRAELTAERFTLYLPDRTVTFPAYCTDAVRLALSGATVRVDELPGLDADDRLILARRLLREAIVVPVATSQR